LPCAKAAPWPRRWQIALRTAQHAEKLGFTRYWLAEHHNMPGIASSATAVLVGYIAGGTSRIRVGSGGVMLPNHAPLVVAEAFGTLAELYPGRIDLGLGRAPGTDPPPCARCAATGWRPKTTFRATWPSCSACWPRAARPAPGRHARRGHQRADLAAGLQPVFGAAGGRAGLPYAFASHFAPRLMLHQAIDLYRRLYQPSALCWPKPYVAIGVPLIAAPTDDEAEYLASSTYQRVLGILTCSIRPCVGVRWRSPLRFAASGYDMGWQ
jgi:luciferase family oxidoreductase group 1